MEQYVKWPQMTDRQIERMQEQLFRETGPYYHLHTKPLDKGLIFQDDEERRTALNFIGIIAKEIHIDILAYALMSNHFHFVIQGKKVDVLEFFRRLKKRLSYYLARKGRPGVLDSVTPETPAITTLAQFRNEIAYVIRNPYVVLVDVNPLAYPWCSGFLYFNPFLPKLESIPVSALTYREKRNITRSSEADLDPSIRIRDGMIAPECFVNYQLVEQMFPHARKFTWWVFKNVEAQIGVAKSLDEHPNLSDDELYIVTMRICENEFCRKNAKEMSEQEQKKLAVMLKNDWYASNAQVARLSGLDPRVVDELFPLAAKKR